MQCFLSYILILICCNTFAFRSEAQVNIDSVINTNVVYKINTYPARDFTFRVYSEATAITHFRQPDKRSWNYADSTCSIDSIVIFRNADKKFVQTIDPPENAYSCRIGSSLTIEDMNFDSYEDIRIIQFTGTVNIPSYYWLYNSQRKKFVRDTILEQVSSAQFDHKNKLVISAWTASAGDHGVTTYQYINGKLTKIKEEEEVYSNDEKTGKEYIVLTVKARINGRMKVVSRTREKNSKY